MTIPTQEHSSFFSNALLAWFDQYGRKTLPWQNPIQHYRVWVSEIMLQQTQVATVIDYFNAFILRFPTIQSLAQASIDEVLRAWAGLGYYSRAKNLHRSAQLIEKEWDGKFPDHIEGAMSLPGIGRSTAGAILSIVDQQPLAILDGNVKRVLTRYYEIPGWPGDLSVQKRLWDLAEKLVHQTRPHHYTQAIMDLGAMVCTSKNPQCGICPVHTQCQAYQQGTVTQYPHAKPYKKQAEREAEFSIIILNHESILLHKQEKKGVWNGLWVPPNTLFESKHWLTLWEEYLDPSGTEIKLRPFTHIFTHFKLTIQASLFYLKTMPHNLDFVLEAVKLPELHQYALPAPFKKLLSQLCTTQGLLHDYQNRFLCTT